jgi:hypothetical protein
MPLPTKYLPALLPLGAFSYGPCWLHSRFVHQLLHRLANQQPNHLHVFQSQIQVDYSPSLTLRDCRILDGRLFPYRLRPKFTKLQNIGQAVPHSNAFTFVKCMASRKKENLAVIQVTCYSESLTDLQLNRVVFASFVAIVIISRSNTTDSLLRRLIRPPSRSGFVLAVLQVSGIWPLVRGRVQSLQSFMLRGARESPLGVRG